MAGCRFLRTSTKPSTWRRPETAYFVVRKEQVPNPNDGYGDYRNFTYSRLGPVQAESPQSARSNFRKVFPALRFSPRFSPWLLSEEDLGPWADAPIDHAWTLFSGFHFTAEGLPKETP
jgi:hypothetical protein